MIILNSSYAEENIGESGLCIYYDDNSWEEHDDCVCDDSCACDD